MFIDALGPLALHDVDIPRVASVSGREAALWAASAFWRRLAIPTPISRDSRPYPHTIRNERDRRAALARIDELMEAGEGSSGAVQLQLLAILVERYEREAFPIDPPSPVDAIRFRMEQMGYTRGD